MITGKQNSRTGKLYRPALPPADNAHILLLVLIALRDPARDDFGHLKIVASSSRAEAFHNARPILYLTILAHLPLAFEPRDGKAETHNAAQHNLSAPMVRLHSAPAGQ
jgi:hypothetical protein